MTPRAMERLGFVLPEWTRVIWASAAAKEHHAPRIARASAAWTRIERESVAERLRPAALQVLRPEGLPELSAWAAERGLVVLTLARQAGSDTYRASGGPPEPGRPWRYRVALTRPDHAADWHEAWAAGDDEQVGRLLGYPDCCRAFFRRVWIDDGYLDTTWPMYLGSGGDAAGPPEANILLRWLGIRLVSHLPCSFRCEATVRIGRAMEALGRRHGHGEALDTIHAMLKWPTQWSALHGIAEIRTPACKVSTRADATAREYRVSRPGTRYPEHGAEGLRPPFRAPENLVQITTTTSFRRSVDPAAEWRDNGFASWEAMRVAHDVVIEATPDVDAAVGRILDLGSGNGALLERLGRPWPRAELIGVERDAGRAARSGLRRAKVRTHVADLFEWRWNGAYDLVVLMPGRLLEADAERRARLLERLDADAGTLLCYAYGDWLQRHGSLRALLSAAGLEAVGEPVETDRAAAAVAVITPPAPTAAP